MIKLFNKILFYYNLNFTSKFKLYKILLRHLLLVVGSSRSEKFANWSKTASNLNKTKKKKILKQIKSCLKIKNSFIKLRLLTQFDHLSKKKII